MRLASENTQKCAMLNGFSIASTLHLAYGLLLIPHKKMLNFNLSKISASLPWLNIFIF